MSSPKIRCDNNSSIGLLCPEAPQKIGESEISFPSEITINLINNSNSLNLINPDESFKNKEKAKCIEITRDENCIEFFIKAKGHNFCFYKENKDIKIKNVIENYIQKQKLAENIKNNFFNGDKPIRNLDAKISDLEIKTLDIIIEK